MALTELGLALLQVQQTRNMSERELAVAIGVNRAVIISLTSDKDSDAYMVPRLPTLQKIATWLETPLWRVLEMCGYDSGVRPEGDALAARLATLVHEFPQLRERMDAFSQLPPDQLVQVLNFAAYLRDQREPAGEPVRGTKQALKKPRKSS